MIKQIAEYVDDGTISNNFRKIRFSKSGKNEWGPWVSETILGNNWTINTDGADGLRFKYNGQDKLFVGTDGRIWSSNAPNGGASIGTTESYGIKYLIWN